MVLNFLRRIFDFSWDGKEWDQNSDGSWIWKGNRIPRWTILAFMVLIPVGIILFKSVYVPPFLSPTTWGSFGMGLILWAYIIQVYWAIELFEELDGAPWDSTREYTKGEYSPWHSRPLRSNDLRRYGDAPRNFRGFKRALMIAVFVVVEAIILYLVLKGLWTL
jgi:hypothetical protein